MRSVLRASGESRKLLLKKNTLKAGKETGHHFPWFFFCHILGGQNYFVQGFPVTGKTGMNFWTNPIQTHRSCWPNNHGSFLPPFPFLSPSFSFPTTFMTFIHSINTYWMTTVSWTLWQKLETLHKEYSPPSQHSHCNSDAWRRCGQTV